MLKIGMTASFSKTITETDVYNYAGITGDFNPVHVDKVTAERGAFQGRIAHGMLSGGLISTVIGMYLPGPGTIYLGQNLNFKYPVRFGDTITAKVTVKEIVNPDKGIYKLETLCINQEERIVIDGEAIVKYLV